MGSGSNLEAFNIHVEDFRLELHVVVQCNWKHFNFSVSHGQESPYAMLERKFNPVSTLELQHI
jgi:hypothetical protein